MILIGRLLWLDGFRTAGLSYFTNFLESLHLQVQMLFPETGRRESLLLSGVMEVFRTELLEEITKPNQIEAEVEQSVISFSLQEEHRADILEQLRLCALENIDSVGRSLINQKFFDLALPIFRNDR